MTAEAAAAVPRPAYRPRKAERRQAEPRSSCMSTDVFRPRAWHLTCARRPKDVTGSGVSESSAACKSVPPLVIDLHERTVLAGSEGNSAA